MEKIINGITVHCLNSLFEKNKPHNMGSDYEYIELENDDFYHFDRTTPFETIKGVEEIWYWYAIDYYEGNGRALLRIGDTYDIMYLYYCECYSPLDQEYTFEPHTKQGIFDNANKEEYKYISVFNLV